MTKNNRYSYNFELMIFSIIFQIIQKIIILKL